MSKSTGTTDRQIEDALHIAYQYGDMDGAHHKMWVIDQMVRELCGTAEAYERWVTAFRAGEHGPNTYTWDEGIAP